MRHSRRHKANGSKQQQQIQKKTFTALKFIKKKPLKTLGLVTVGAASLLSGLIIYKIKNSKPSLYKRWIG